ncbi:MAG: hypothetical protein ACJAUZ_002950 [Flavobacteriaceae bacterium]|jgi:hypothetical protein
MNGFILRVSLFTPFIAKKRPNSAFCATTALPWSFFENEIELQAKWPGYKEAKSTVVNLRVQACNDEICLAPETLAITIYPEG